MDEKQWKTVIGVKSSPFDLKLKEVWQYRDLCLTFIRKNFITRYKQTVFGPLYMVLSPLLTSGLFTLVFGTVVGVSTDGAPEFLFYMIGNLVWALFSGSFSGNSGIFTSNAYIMGKVYFPRLVIPLSNLLTQWIDIAVQYVLFLGFYAVFAARGYGIHMNWLVLIVPLWLMQMSLFGFGCGLMVSSLTVKYRDLGVLVGFVMKVLMYASPILYPLSNIQDGWMKSLALCNPLAPVLEIIRYAFFGTGFVAVNFLIMSLVITGIILIGSLILFNQTEKTFIDTV